MRRDVEGCLVAAEATASGLEASFRFPPELPVFAGHFPGHPLVPGVFLIEAVRLASERVTGEELRIADVMDAKFTHPVGPGDTVAVVVDLERGETSWTCRAALRTGGSDAARIRLRLRED